MRESYGANEEARSSSSTRRPAGAACTRNPFNDIRTTAGTDFHLRQHQQPSRNAYDEAITTPTEDSVRRAMAIQLIINREWGIGKNENPNQGSFIIEELTDLVEEAVLKEFKRFRARRRAGCDGDRLQ